MIFTVGQRIAVGELLRLLTVLMESQTNKPDDRLEALMAVVISRITRLAVDGAEVDPATAEDMTEIVATWTDPIIDDEAVPVKTKGRMH